MLVARDEFRVQLEHLELDAALRDRHLVLGDLAEVHRVVDGAVEHVGRAGLRPAHADRLRAQGEGHGVAGAERLWRLDRADDVADRRADFQTTVGRAPHGAFEEVRFADEVGDEAAVGAQVHFLGLAALLDQALVENREAVGNGERFLLVVRDVDRGEPRLLADAADFRAHLEAQFRVEVRKRLVEQEALGPDDESARERDALLLAARELVRLVVRAVGHPHHLQCLGDAPLPLGGRDFAKLQSKGDVLAHGHVRPQGVALEHHAGVALVGREIRDIRVADPDRAAVRDAEARDAAEQGGLAAAARAEQEEEFAGFDPEAHIVHRTGGPERLVQLINVDRNGHEWE